MRGLVSDLVRRAVLVSNRCVKVIVIDMGSSIVVPMEVIIVMMMTGIMNISVVVSMRWVMMM